MSNRKEFTVDRVLACDVILGRGKSVHFHPGNVVYREIVRARSLEYAGLKGIERDTIAREVIEHVHSNGGRFLKPTKDASQWTKCCWSTVVTKVKQALRDMTKQRSRNEPSGAHQSPPMIPDPVNPKARLVGGTSTDSQKVAAERSKKHNALDGTGFANIPKKSENQVEPIAMEPTQQHQLDHFLTNSASMATQLNASMLPITSLIAPSSSIYTQSTPIPLASSLVQFPSFPLSSIPPGFGPIVSSNVGHPMDSTTAALLLERAILLEELQRTSTRSNATPPPSALDVAEFLRSNKNPH